MLDEKTSIIQRVGLFLGIFSAACIILFVNFGSEYYNAKLVAATASLMSIWWITEAVPLAVTSLIPLVLFPLTGAVSGKTTSEAYMNSTIFLFMGGFIIAIAMEKWNLHKRVALTVINIFGKNPAQIVLGFMIATGFISMWISNTATALMIFPIGLAVLTKLENEFGKERTKKFGIALMLSIAYAASIGGMGTLVGTPPNLVFARVYKIAFPDKQMILFADWMKFAVPITIIMLVLTWIILVKIVFRTEKDLVISKEIIKSEKEKLGKTTFEEKVVLLVFLATSLLWIFRSELDLGFIKIPGWSLLFPKADFIDDGTIAITMAIVLFLIPSKNKSNDTDFILNFSAISKIPWDIILLFGGGFALAEGFVTSGLSKFIGQQFASFGGMPLLLIIALICFSVTALSELTSNTATAQIVLPILASLAVELKIEPMLLMVPATLAASFGFMLPVGTPPNAIVFSSQRLKVRDMVKTGIIVDLLSVLIITLFAYLFLI
jgi:solute carrier family 13 (sodium-dependent dicarboxylate transporter), member 2/3/5